ncbi:MAG: alpha/beta hydrolase [bacterium]
MQLRLLFNIILAFSLLLPVTGFAYSKPSITFKSSDGLLISADTYMAHPADNTPLIILFHQAGWSRGEYIETAPKLNKMGFNCIAVDLRSGDEINDVVNMTAQRAQEAGLGHSYADAIVDMVSALKYARKHYPKSRIIAWGSSYSAALVLRVAGSHPGLVDGVLSFSPGEYFHHLGKSKTWIEEAAKNITVPVFITSAANEADEWKSIYQAIPTQTKQSFVPKSEGHHGSRALWRKFADSNDYWKAVEQFLGEYFPRK